MNLKKNITVKQIKSFQDLKNGIDNSKKYLLFIYADWCGHCKAMKPDLKKFLSECKEKEGNVFIGSLEHDTIQKYQDISHFIEKELKKNVEGYPTIIYGEKGMIPNELKGERNYQNFNDILSKLCSQNGGRRRRKNDLENLALKKKKKKKKI